MPSAGAGGGRFFSLSYPGEPLEFLGDRDQILARDLIRHRLGKLAAFPGQFLQVLGWRWHHRFSCRLQGAEGGHDGYDFHVTTGNCDLSGT